MRHREETKRISVGEVMGLNVEHRTPNIEP
jgi:hypothetical protein